MSSGDDWDASDSEVAAPAAPVAAIRKSKFADEDADEADVKDSWEDSDEEKPAPAPSGPPPPIRQKGITKAKIAEKEAAEKAKLKAAEEAASESPAERRKRELLLQQQQDLENARSLFGEATLGDSKNGSLANSVASLLGSDSNPILSVQNPKTKADFDQLAKNISDSIIEQYGSKPLFPGFVETLCRSLNLPLKDLDVKKVASTLTALGSEKQQAAKGTKKGGKKGKPSLGTVAGGGGGAKTAVSGRGYAADLAVHDEALDDDFDDFM